jgi:hypothetical protein
MTVTIGSCHQVEVRNPMPTILQTVDSADRVLTTRQAEDLSGIPAVTWCRWIRQGVVPGRRLGPRRWVIRLADYRKAIWGGIASTI